MLTTYDLLFCWYTESFPLFIYYMDNLNYIDATG